ncbi:MAG: ABC transporter substrate-binding protein [Candidatus Riflebacteria bacterium]|nr:ABC transporter substrate-binding protein [Candidatus Riflebacteria bacterium]
MKPKHFLIIVFIIWLVTVYMLFGPNSRARKARVEVESAGGGRTEVVFWHAMGGVLGDVMNEMIANYNAQSDKYHLKAVSMGSYDTLSKKLLASLIAKEAPDIAQNYETLTKKFITHKKIVSLDELIEKDIAAGGEDIRKDIIPVLLRNNTYDGILYSFPFNKSVPILYYNKDMFREVGLDPEKPPKSYQQMIEYCKKITDYYGKQPGKYDYCGFASSAANVWTYLCKVRACGGKIVSQGSDGILYSHFDEEPAVKALKILQELMRYRKKTALDKDGKERTVTFRYAKEGQGFDHQNDFTSGKVAMIEASIVSKVYMQNSIRFDWGMAPMPGYEMEKDGEPYLNMGLILSGTNINIFNNGDPEKIAGAWDFVKWFTSTENGSYWSRNTTYLPVRISSVTSPEMMEARRNDSRLNAGYESLEFASFEPRLTAWFEIRDMLADVLEKATIDLAEIGPEGELPDAKTNYCDLMKKDVDAILKYVTDTDDALE